jgi:carbonic anhydrase
MILQRRSVLGGLIGAVPLLASTAAAIAADECAVFTQARQSQMSPDDAINALRAGNDRFLAGQSINCDLIQQVHETADHQSPIAAILGCIDSRVPPELVFDQRIGDIFAARVAGNFANVDILGSLEYATEVAGARAIVVLGHSSCGAIKSVAAGVELGNITAMLDNLKPALAAAGEEGDAHDHAAYLQKVAEQNVMLTAQALVDRSSVLAKRIEAGTLKIAGAMHDVATGRVEWI